LHRTGRGRHNPLEVAIVDDYVSTLFVFVAFDQIVARDRLVFGLAIEDLFHSRVIAIVQLMKADRLRARGGAKPYGE